MDFSSLPRYRGGDDGPPRRHREAFDGSSPGDALALLAITALVLVLGTAAASLVVVWLVAAPAG